MNANPPVGIDCGYVNRNSSGPPLARTTSFFLDLLRLLAAFSVFAIHVVAIWYPAHYTAFTDRAGERSVIIFFVLSGYVIAYSTLRKERDPRGYVLARLSRLYSVLLPAIVLTAVLQVIGTAIHPAPYLHVDRGHDALRYGMVAFFLQSVWFVSTAPPTNGPFWSLCHEFWYYALFGAAVLIGRRAWKLGAMAVCALICGPTVLLLMPSWLLGAACYVYGRTVRVPKALAGTGLLLALAAIALTYPFLPDWPYQGFQPRLTHSAPFGSDLLFGLLITAMIWCADQAFRDTTVPIKLDAIVRWFADHTFSLYLYHFPILFFLAAVVPFDRGNVPMAAAMILLTLALVFGLSLLTESKRPAWRAFFARVWDRCATPAR